MGGDGLGREGGVGARGPHRHHGRTAGRGEGGQGLRHRRLHPRCARRGRGRHRGHGRRIPLPPRRGLRTRTSVAGTSLRPPTHPKGITWLPIPAPAVRDRKSTRLNSSHVSISYAVFCLNKKKIITHI